MNTDNISVNTQSSIRIAGSFVLYFDPFEVEKETKDADIIFITHDHYDHFDPKSIAKVKKEGTKLVAPESMKEIVLKESGMEEKTCYFFKTGTDFELDGMKIETIPAYNKLKPFHPKKKAFAGYIVSMDQVRYYVSGDTDLTEENKKVNCDIALIPIGGKYTMDPKQAAELINVIAPKIAIPTHYGSIVGKPEDGELFKNLVTAEGTFVEFKL